MDWMNQIGILGGISGFYKTILALIVGYFAEIDYLTTFIKKLFLEEQTDEKFYSRFLKEDNYDGMTDAKKNWCSDLFYDEIGQINEADLREYQKER